MAWSKLSMAVGVAAIAIAALEWKQASTANQRVAQLEEQVQRQAQSNQMQQAEITTLDKENMVLHKQVESAAHDTAKARNHNSLAVSAAVAAATKKNKLGDMLKDPAIMEAMRKMQDTINRKQFAKFVKQMQMTPEQSEAFYQLLDENKMAAMKAFETDPASLAKAGQDARQSLESGLRSLLGDDGYAQYQAYETKATAQAQLDQIKTEFAENPLTEDQQQRLLDVITSAHTDISKINAPKDQMDEAMQEQEARNQIVLQKSAEFLSPDQVKILGTSQSNMVSMMKLGATMAQKMYGPTPTR